MSSRPTTPARVACLGFALTVAVTGCGGDAYEDAPSRTDQGPAAVEVSLPAAQPGRCAVPNAQALARNDVAFEGTVTQVDETSATLAVDRWLTGGEADLVTVALPSAELVEGGYAVEFEADATYLVSATDGTVSVCGFTGESTPELVKLYQEAFGRGTPVS